MDNLEHILAIELMNAAQGIDFRRPLKTSPVLERFLHAYRKEVPFVKDDIVMYKEIRNKHRAKVGMRGIRSKVLSPAEGL